MGTTYADGTDADVSLTRPQNDLGHRSYGDNRFIPSYIYTATPSAPVRHLASPQPTTSGLFQPFLNETHGDDEFSKASPGIPQADVSNVPTRPTVDTERPWLAQDDCAFSGFRSPLHSAAATQPHVIAADESGGYPIALPTPINPRSRGKMLSDPENGFVVDTFAALGHQFINEDAGTNSGTFGLRNHFTTFDPMFEYPSSLNEAANPLALGQGRADYYRSRTEPDWSSMRPANDGADTLGNSILPSYNNNEHGTANGWASTDGMTSLTATFNGYTSNGTLQPDDLCHPHTGPSVPHPHNRLHHSANCEDFDLMIDSPTKMDQGQRCRQITAARMPLNKVTPQPFQQTPLREQLQLRPLVEIDGTFLAPSHSALSPSRSDPQEPVRFLFRDSSDRTISQQRATMAMSTGPLSKSSPSVASRRSNTSHRSIESVDVCPHCCFVSRGKKRSDRLSNLNRHIRDKHNRAEGAKPVCPEPGCGKAFQRSDYVLRHRRKSHGLPTTTGGTTLSEGQMKRMSNTPSQVGANHQRV